jgi:hypothetical protein
MGIDINKIVDIVEERQKYKEALDCLNLDRYSMEICCGGSACYAKIPRDFAQELKTYAKEACEWHINKLEESLKEAIDE